MSERVNIVEEPEANARVLAEIATWGPLKHIDRHEELNLDKYQQLVTVARGQVSHSLVAAALVSAWDGNKEINEYDYGENIAAALNTASTVKAFQEFYQQHPSGEIGLHLGKYHLILFQTNAMRLGAYYDSKHGNHAYLTIEAPLQSEIGLHSSHMSTYLERSDHGEEGHYGGYQAFTVGFNDIQAGSRPLMLRERVPPLIVGRNNISEYFDWQALQESLTGGTTHRLSSLAHAIWRLRKEDVELAASVDTTAEQYGLVGLWTEQYRQEIGSKAAHAVLRGMLDGPVPADMLLRESMLMQEITILNDESRLYGTDPGPYLPSAHKNAQRLGVETDDATLIRAIKYVFQSA